MAIPNLHQAPEQPHHHDDVFVIAPDAERFELLDTLARYHSQMRDVCNAISAADDGAIAGTFFMLGDMADRCDQLTNALHYLQGVRK